MEKYCRMKDADIASPAGAVAPVRWDLEDIVAGLREVRAQWRAAQHRTLEPGGREFPSRDALIAISASLRGALFPLRLGPSQVRQESEDHYVGYTLDTTLNALLEQVRLELRYTARHDGLTATQVEERAVQIVRDFAASLPGLRALLDSDVVAAFRGDPAARSVDEVLLCYPGILAMINHRIAHKLYQLELPLLARIIAEIAHSETGADAQVLRSGFRETEDYFARKGGADDAVKIARKEQDLLAQVDRFLAAADFDSAAGAARDVAHTCKNCHDVYKPLTK